MATFQPLRGPKWFDHMDLRGVNRSKKAYLWHQASGIQHPLPNAAEPLTKTIPLPRCRVRDPFQRYGFGVANPQ